MDIANDATQNGVVNHSVAYPYASSRYVPGAYSEINPRNTSSRDIGYDCRPHSPVAAANVSATGARD
jgi:hypothetical protein